MDAIADGMSLGPLSVAGIAMGAPMLILAGAALVGIVAGIRAFSSIAEDADLPALKQNVSFIVSGLADTFAEVGKKYPGGGSSLLSALTGNTSGQSVVAMGISAVGGMGKALTGIAKGVQAMANLKFPTGFDKDGNPTGYETIDIGTVSSRFNKEYTIISSRFKFCNSQRLDRLTQLKVVHGLVVLHMRKVLMLLKKWVHLSII